MTDELKLKYSNVFIWIGLIAWVPFILSRVLKYDVSFVPFLVVHLIGVLGGAVLRGQATREDAPPSKRKVLLKKVSTALLLVGVSVWGVYFSLEWITGVERVITPFLMTHLAFVLTGAGIKIFNFVSK